MVQITMYPAQPDSPDFVLAADITAIATSITFTDLTGLLAAPNTLTMRTDDADETPETVYYSAYVSGNTLTVTRAYGGTTAKSFVAGAKACRAHTAFDHNTFRSNILDLDSATFHKATAGEINALTSKTTPVSADVLMIEDSAAGAFTKAKIAISTLTLTTDSRLSDARTPTAHKSTHVTGGTDIIPTATAAATGLLPILENTGLKFLRDDGTWQLFTTGTVTSVAAGNGMTFTTITTTGTVTMGTPGSVTSSSTNAVAAGTHTHAIDTTIWTAANGKSVTTPIVDGTATIGATNTWADGGHIHPTDTSRAAATSLGSWAAFSPAPVWGTADPTITSTVARYARTGNIVTFNVSFVISNGNAASSLVMALPVAAPQTANYQLPLIAFKKITTGGSSIMSDPFAYIDYTLATPVIKFNQFGTLPSGYTGNLNISGTYEVT